MPSLIWWLVAMAFLVLWRIRLTSWHCGVGFALTGTGFALDAFPLWGNLNPFLSGLCYIAASYLYSGCVLYHFEVKLRFRRRFWLPAVYLPLHIHFVFGIESLQADLFLTDMIFALIFFHALLVTTRMAASAADRFMLVSGGLVSFDCVVRATLFTFVISSPDQLADFADSHYSMAVQITTTTIGLLFPISVVAAMAAKAIERQRDSAETDPLTGLLNRRGFFRIVHASRAGGSGCGALLMADIDHFKRVNDAFGHKAGDLVIRGLAAELRHGLERSAIVARFGGEEFVAYLPGATAADALIASNGVNHAFGARSWHEEGINTRITVCIGVTNIEAPELDVDAAMDRADRALYIAKESGRNRVIVNTEQHDLADPRDQALETPITPMPNSVA